MELGRPKRGIYSSQQNSLPPRFASLLNSLRGVWISDGTLILEYDILHNNFVFRHKFGTFPKGKLLVKTRSPHICPPDENFCASHSSDFLYPQQAIIKNKLQFINLKNLKQPCGNILAEIKVWPAMDSKNSHPSYHSIHSTKIWCCRSDKELTWRKRWEKITKEEQLSNWGF